jgi:homoserine O-acetyltransferase
VGGVGGNHVLRGTIWGPEDDLPALAQRAGLLRRGESVGAERGPCTRGGSAARPKPRSSGLAPPLRPDVRTVLCIHALTGDARVGGSGGWWEPLVGPGCALDPNEVRVLCFNNLGSCYGSSGPRDQGFPSWATQAVDALGIEKVALATGGSLGGMVALCLAALAPSRFERIAPIAASESASAWLIGFNHVARQALLSEPTFPECDGRGLELARQIAMLSYRAEAGLEERQGRKQEAEQGGPTASWSPRRPYRVQTYLEHQGQKLRRRFDGRSYLTQIDAMDHHDLARPPVTLLPRQAGEAGWGLHELVSGEVADATAAVDGFGVPRLTASVLLVSIDSDQLYFPAQTQRLARRLRERGLVVEEATLQSAHGHDAFLIEWAQLDPILRRALQLPLSRTPP